MSDASLKPDPVGMLAEEFVERMRRGERPTIGEYCRRHVDLAPRIRELFPSLVMIEQLAPSLEDSLDSLLYSDDGQRRSAPVCVGDYRVVREIGRGGMGVVYEAVQESLSRRVALKVLPRRASADEKSLERFRAEARTIARLHHTNIVPVYEIGQDQGFSFIAMQFIDGQGLDATLGAGQVDDSLQAARSSTTTSMQQGVSVSSASNSSHAAASDRRGYYRHIAQIGVQVAEALDYAHRRGVVHRDIKPSNLLLDASGVVWVTDFGLAKSEGDALTRTGDVVGTLRFMAPERFAGRSESRGDVYSLGATLYELLTQRPAYRASERAALMQEILRSNPERPRQVDPHIPRDLETIVLKAMDREPAARYGTAGQLADDLRRFLNDQPIHARRLWFWARLWRWCLRNPEVALLSVLTVTVFLAGLSGVTWKWREAERARKDELAARRAADDAAAEVRQGMVRLKQANALLDLGGVLVNAERWDDAELAFNQALQLRPDHVRAAEDRGHLLYSRLGLWDLAAADLERAFELQRPALADRWWNHALLRVLVNDREGYLRVRAEMRQRFGRSFNSHNSADLIRTLALDPQPNGIDETIVKLAETVVATEPKNPLFLYVQGVALCRAGKFERAIECCRASLDGTPTWSARGLNFPIIAIAHDSLGQPSEARIALDQAGAELDGWIEARYRQSPEHWVRTRNATSFWPLSCWDYLEFQIYEREARRRLGITSADDPRLHMLRARGLAGLRHSSDADVVYSAALALAPRDPQVRLEYHRNRGYSRAHRCDFLGAANEFALASGLTPTDSDLFRFRAYAHSAAGDEAGYRSVCREMVARFRDTSDPAVAYDVVDACTVRANSLDDMKSLLPFARLGATWYVGGIRILAAAYCRADQFNEAVQCYAETSEMTHLRARDLGFLALAHARLGHVDQARACLSDAAQWINQANREEIDDLTATRPVWDGWYERRDVERLLDEVKATLGEQPSVDTKDEAAEDDVIDNP